MKFFKTDKRTLVVPTPADNTAITVPTMMGIPWQRMLVSMLGVLIIMGVWRLAVMHLYSLPSAESITAFTSITNNCLYTIAALVVFFVTNKLVFDWKNSTVSQVVQEAQVITETIVKPKHFDSPEID